MNRAFIQPSCITASEIVRTVQSQNINISKYINTYINTQYIPPTGLTYMHTHSCRYSRNKMHTMKDMHTYTYQARIQDLPQTSKLKLFATFLQSQEQNSSQMLAVALDTSLHIQLLNILQKKVCSICFIVADDL